MLKRVALCLSVAGMLFVLAGCRGEKDYSHERITPVGTPNPRLHTATPGGGGGAPTAPTGGAATSQTRPATE